MRIPPGESVPLQQSLREVWAAIDAISQPGNQDFHGRRIINAGDAVALQDYVTLAQLNGAVDGPATGAPKPQPRISAIIVGTHDQRIVTSPIPLPIGTGFFETDRGALYFAALVDGLPAWLLYFGFQTGSYAARHGDLTLNDDNYWWMAQDQASLHRWTGASWHYQVGNIVGTFSTRPTAGGTDIATGFRFTASDRGYQQWVYDRANVWWQFAGGGEPTRGTISAITTSLGTHDDGYLFYATDFDRLYRWSGSAWADAPGQPMRGMIAYFGDLKLPGTGWAICSGGSATFSTATGGTASINVPDLTTSLRFIRSTASTTYTTGGSATTHTHQVDPPSTVSGPPSDTIEIEAGTGEVVATDDHTHATDVAPFASAGPSGTSGDDALPPYVELKPYIRL